MYTIQELTIQVAVFFMKFTGLMLIHSRINPTVIVFCEDRPNRTTDIEENVPSNLFFGSNSLSMAFFEKKP